MYSLMITSYAASGGESTLDGIEKEEGEQIRATLLL